MESERRTIARGRAEERSESPSRSVVTAHSTSEDRVVFTETDNTDGWIATDSAVALQR